MNSLFLNNEQSVTVIDVRTPEEFNGGHVMGSFNIPLQQIRSKLQEIKSMNPPIILCCASGNRSSQAVGYLSALGIECTNGGSWLEVQYSQTQKI